MRKIVAVLAAVALLLVMLPPASAGTGSPATRTYTTSADFDEGKLVGVEDTTVADQLQLSKQATTLPFIWIPNNNGTVSKVDTETGNELGRYRVTPPGLPEAGSPSRTTVDLQGNVWVGNRTAGTVVKIGLLEAGQCVDRNGNTTIETARDLNADGSVVLDEVLPWGSDECVLQEVVLLPGQEGAHVPGTYTGPYDTNYWGVSPRSLAVDARNNLWAGTGTSQKFYYIDGATGAILNVIDGSPWALNAYGATIDRSGVLWSVHPLLRIDPAALGVGTAGLAGAASREAASTGLSPYGGASQSTAPPYEPFMRAVPKAGDRSRSPYLPPLLPVAASLKSGGGKPSAPALQPLETSITAGITDLINAAFSTVYTYDTPADSVGNIQAEMRTEVRSAANCPADGTGKALTLDLRSPSPMVNLYASGNQVLSPPEGVDYQWSFPALPGQCGGFAIGQTEQTVSLMTGMTVSRSVDQRQFTGPGPFTQTLTISLTPAESFREVRVHGRSDVDGLGASISAITGGDFNIFPDGRGFELRVNNPGSQTYTWQVTITIPSLPPDFQALDYMPDLAAGGYVNFGEQHTSTGSSLTGSSPGLSGEALAEWTWQSAADSTWQWVQERGKQVHLAGSVSDPLAPQAEVWAGLETLYSFYVPGDSVDNSAAVMQAGVSTNLHNMPDSKGLPVDDPILDLQSSQTITNANSSGQPLTPPEGINYRWGFADMPEGANGWANGQTGQTALLEPGFTASREVDQRDFTAPGTQTLTLRVTPSEPMDLLQVHGRSDPNGLAARFVAASGENLSLQPDGLGFHASVVNPVVGQTYVWTVTTAVPAPPAGQTLRYMPDIFVQKINRTATGTHDGSNLLRATELATWNWQATGNYRWHWEERSGKQAHMAGSAQDPTPQLFADLATTYTHYTHGDLAANTEARLKATVNSGVSIGGPGQMVTDAMLDLSSELPIQGVWSSGTPVLPPPDGVDHRWAFAGIQDGSRAHAGARLDHSVMMPTGLTISRTVDQRRFTGPSTQVLTLTVTPEEAMRGLGVNGNVKLEGVDAAVTAVAGESIYAFPDGSGFGAFVANPAPGSTYVWTVTIAIRSLPAGYRTLDYTPELSVRAVQSLNEGTAGGGSLSMPSLSLDAGPLVTWAWQAPGTYRWHWRQEVSKQVQMVGAAFDPDAPIRRIQLNAGEYALAPDYLGHLFVSGFEQKTLSKLETATGEVLWVKDTPDGCARGVAITPDNHVWLADTCRNSLLRYDNDGNLLAEITGLSQPSGVAVDAAGKVWATDLGSESIHRIDPQTNAIDLSKPLLGSLGHYSYSDMTGMVSRTISTTTGTWTVLHDSGRAGVPWGSLNWTSSEPAGTGITVRVRSSEDQISWSAWETAEDGAPLKQTASGRYLQIEAALQITAGEVSPVLYDLTVSPAYMSVPLDIKPTSCPNPLNLTERGTLPAAIPGTAAFDVAQIAPETVRLAGVAPVRWDLEDVTTPYAGVIADPPGAGNCTTDELDGLVDLTLQFDAQAIIAALGEVPDGDVVVVELTGQLRDGTPVLGEDVLLIIRR